MVLVYISIILILLHNIKILKLKEYSLNPLSLSNSNAMKGLAAIVVVLHHISQRIDNPGLLIFFRYVGYLSVSLFLFYSGYGLMKSFESKKNYLNGFWTERMPKVIIPFVLSNILFLLIYIVIVGTKYSVYDIFTYILGIRLIDDYKWYIIAIVVLYSGFYFIFKHCSRKKAILGIFLLITGYSYVCRLLGKGPWWYNTTYCFLIGIIFGAYYKSILGIIKKQYTIVTVGMLLLFISTFVLNVFKENVLTSMISSAFFVLMCICLLMKIEIGNKVINLLGSISYEIYLVHGIILDGFGSINNEYIYMIICTVITILIAYIFSVFVKTIIRIYMNMKDKKHHMQV